MIPGSVKSGIEQLLGRAVSENGKMGGGSINQVAAVESGGVKYVLKWNSASLADMFETEARGLKMLDRGIPELTIPEVAGSGVDGGHSWLLLEFVPEESGNAASAEAFGRGLAALHRHTSENYGLDHDNYIGRLPQSNTPESDWITFFTQHRIRPMIKSAIDSGLLPSEVTRQADHLCAAAKDIFPDEPASLLHGDLWGGNYISTNENKTALIDPAVYFGHREIELAFTQLFGRFPEPFYQVYNEAWPLQPGFSERRDLYNLYPVLVHVNLFGGSYCNQARQILRGF